MFASLRVSIFWNISILVIIAAVLTTIVVFRITEKEILKQHISGEERVFSSVRSTITFVVNKNPSLVDTPSPQSELQQLIHQLADQGLFTCIVLINKQHTVVAHSIEYTVGQTAADADLIQAIDDKKVIKRIHYNPTDSQKSLIISSPLYLDKQNLSGALKLIFPLTKVEQHIAASKKMIFLYILLDSAVLILLGTFLLSRYLVKPLEKLLALTEHIAEGSFDPALQISQRNEIGKLSASLSLMSRRLDEEKRRVREYIQNLEEKNKQLEQAQHEIIQSEKLASVGRLAAGIAHEIGNPIGIIRGYLHLLRDQGIAVQEKLDYIHRMEAETERIHSIIRELLDYAQPSPPHNQALDLNAVIKDAYSLVSYQKGFQNINVRFILQQDLLPLVADEKQIRQIIINLTLNALDAMPNGGTTTFKTSLDNLSGEAHIVFSVADTGEGIPEELQKRIFDPFFTTKEPGKGTGLGLSNVHRIIDSLGGKISVSSTPKSGTIFTIIFPRVTTVKLRTTNNTC